MYKARRFIEIGSDHPEADNGAHKHTNSMMMSLAYFYF
jgi:hypothetical protein